VGAAPAAAPPRLTPMHCRPTPDAQSDDETSKDVSSPYELRCELGAWFAKYEETERELLESAVAGQYLLHQNEELQQQIEDLEQGHLEHFLEDMGTSSVGMASTSCPSSLGQHSSSGRKANLAAGSSGSGLRASFDTVSRRESYLPGALPRAKKHSLGDSASDYDELAILQTQNKALDEDCRLLEQKNRSLTAHEDEMECKLKLVMDQAERHLQEAKKHQDEAQHHEANYLTLVKEKPEWQNLLHGNHPLNGSKVENRNMKKHIAALSDECYALEEMVEDVHYELAESQTHVTELYEISEEFESRSQSYVRQRDEAVQELADMNKTLDEEKLNISEIIMARSALPMGHRSHDDQHKDVGLTSQQVSGDKPESLNRKLKRAIKTSRIHSPRGDDTNGNASDSDVDCDKVDEFITRCEELDEVINSVRNASSESCEQLSHAEVRCHELEDKLASLGEPFGELSDARLDYLHNEAVETVAERYELQTEIAVQTARSHELEQELHELFVVNATSMSSKGVAHSKMLHTQAGEFPAFEVEGLRDQLTIETHEFPEAVGQETPEEDFHKVLLEQLAEARESRDVEGAFRSEKISQVQSSCRVAEDLSERVRRELMFEQQQLGAARNEMQQLAKVHDCLKQVEDRCDEEAEEAARLRAMLAWTCWADQWNSGSVLSRVRSRVLHNHQPALARILFEKGSETLPEPEVEGEPEKSEEEELEDELVAELRIVMDDESRRCAEVPAELEGVIWKLRREGQELREETASAVHTENETKATFGRLEEECMEMQVCAKGKRRNPEREPIPSFWSRMFCEACVRYPVHRAFTNHPDVGVAALPPPLDIQHDAHSHGSEDAFPGVLANAPRDSVDQARVGWTANRG